MIMICKHPNYLFKFTFLSIKLFNNTGNSRTFVVIVLYIMKMYCICIGEKGHLGNTMRYKYNNVSNPLFCFGCVMNKRQL